MHSCVCVNVCVCVCLFLANCYTLFVYWFGSKHIGSLTRTEQPGGRIQILLSNWLTGHLALDRRVRLDPLGSSRTGIFIAFHSGMCLMAFTMDATPNHFRCQFLVTLAVCWPELTSPWDACLALSLEIDSYNDGWHELLAVVAVETSFGVWAVAWLARVIALSAMPHSAIDDALRQQRQPHAHLFDLVIGFEWLVDWPVARLAVAVLVRLDDAYALRCWALYSVPCDSCNCSSVWWLELTSLDRPHSRNSTLRQHNDENRPWISPHTYSPNECPKYFGDATYANDERSIPKYPLFPIWQHFHPPSREKKWIEKETIKINKMPI